MVKRTLSILNQLGLCNAGLLTAHYAPVVKQVVEDMIIELAEEQFHGPFLELLNIVPAAQADSATSLKTLGSVIVDIAAESKDRDEFEFMVELQMRIFRLWKIETHTVDSTDDTIRDNCYRHAAAAAAQNKTQEWAKTSGSPLPVADISSLSKELYEHMTSGKYFFDKVYDTPVEMNTKGEIVLVSAAPEEEWAEVFDGLEIQ